MIFSVFVFLFALAIIFIGLGYAVDIPIFSLVGSIFIIGLGVIILGAGVEVQTGTYETYKYGDNYDTYHYDGYNESAPPQLNELNIFHINETKIYEPYDFGGIGNTNFGILTLLLGMGLFVVVVATAGD